MNQISRRSFIAGSAAAAATAALGSSAVAMAEEAAEELYAKYTELGYEFNS